MGDSGRFFGKFVNGKIEVIIAAFRKQMDPLVHKMTQHLSFSFTELEPLSEQNFRKLILSSHPKFCIWNTGRPGRDSHQIKAYFHLINRSQTIKTGDNLSRKQLIKYGVPQGSVLGPLLFIMYASPLSKTMFLC